MFQAFIFIYKKLQKANKCLKCLLFLYLLGTNIPRSNTQFPSNGGLGAIDPAALSAILLAAGLAASQLNEGEEESSSVCKPCGTVVDACSGVNCGNGGKCVVAGGEKTCICPKGGFVNIGESCKKVVDACSGVSCGNGGKCVVAGGEKTCICPKGFVNIGESCKKACPVGTVEYDNTASNNRLCYYPVFTEQSWDDSRTKCKQKYSDGDLADIPNQGADDLITGAFFNFPDKYWIGINDKGQSSKFQYLNPSTGIPPGKEITYNNFIPGQPSGDGDCVEVFTADFKWNDSNCGIIRYALCSIILPN